jgi:hypothetical protein
MMDPMHPEGVVDNKKESCARGATVAEGGKAMQSWRGG